MVKLAVLMSVSFFSFLVSAELLDQGEYAIESKMEYVRLSVEAKCRAPRFEDDGYTVFYSVKSLAEVEQYRGYSSKLIGRTCGKRGSATELSSRRFEKVEVLLFNYGSAKTDFDDKVRDLIDGF